MLAALKAIWAFKELIIAGIVVAVIAGLAWSVKTAYSERDEYKAQVAVLKKEIATKEAEWGREVMKWDAQVERQRQEIEQIKKRNAAAINKERKKFEEIFKENERVRQNVEANVVGEGYVGGVHLLGDRPIVVPANFVRLYNQVAESSRVARYGGEAQASGATAELAGKVETYEAATFADVVLGNALDCVDLAARHNSLVDILNNLEKSDGLVRPTP